MTLMALMAPMAQGSIASALTPGGGLMAFMAYLPSHTIAPRFRMAVLIVWSPRPQDRSGPAAAGQ
jgi:hypothetical protein